MEQLLETGPVSAAYDAATFRRDLVAGLTVAAVAVPQAMAYALIAGIPPQYGLFTAIVVTALALTILGSSDHLVNGPTNAISLVVFSEFQSQRCFRVVERAMYAGATRFGFRLVHYAVMGNHVHFLVEAPDKRGLARALKGLGVRIARGLNRVMKRQGRVIGDRYHAHVLRTPTEVKRARMYLLTNAQTHYRIRFADPSPRGRTWPRRGRGCCGGCPCDAAVVTLPL